MGIETHQLKTLEEFRAVAGQSVGVIVVTDKATGNHTHRPTCDTISEATFTMKVLENGGKNGRYYFFLRAEDAQRELGASVCAHCDRE
jgi:hypothetical protein